jgi:thiamine-monophosphate kinase
MTPPRLGPGREFDRVRRIAAALGPRGAGLGDDCAVLPSSDRALVVSTDASVEAVHFRRDWLTLEEIGWRATAAALSDLAAEGAEPAGLLVALTVPPAAGDADVVAVMRGAGAAAGAVGAAVVGGDLSAGPAWSLAVTVLGWAARPVTRSGARPGDGIWVTGMLGGPRAALEAWRRNEPPDPMARAAFAHPMPRIAAGRWLAEHGARAMIDVSDGLGADAAHLAAGSEVAIAIDLERVPVAMAAVAEASRLGISPEQFAAESGEEYELLVALPESFDPDLVLDLRQAAGVLLTRVGSVTPGAGVRSRLGGADVTLTGYDHFDRTAG